MGDRSDQQLATAVRVDLRSVTKISLVCYTLAGLALVAFAAALSIGSQASGWTAHFEHLGRVVFGLKSLPLEPVDVTAFMSAFAALVTVAGTVVNVMCCLVYNRISHLVGGVRVATRGE